MSAANSLFGGPAGRPQIYAYSEPLLLETAWAGPRSGRGLLKVGYTTRRDVKTRIREQYPTVRHDGQELFKLLFSADAIDHQGRYFKDHQVHAALEERGYRRLKGEWFECTVEELHSVMTEFRTGQRFDVGRVQTFPLRDEQEDAVSRTAKYFTQHGKGQSGRAPRFLWNAKMRFGKTFAAYQLARRMDWTRVLVLTFKPAVEDAWRSDLKSHADFDRWQFVGQGDELKPIDIQRPLVWFASFQDMLGTGPNGGLKEKFKFCLDCTWDCVILDEYHFGSWRDSAKQLYEQDALPAMDEIDVQQATETLSSSSFLYLSGTPFRALSQGEFAEDQIYSWTYSDEQKAKAEWPGDELRNPYRSLPKMVMMTYEVPDAIREIAKTGELNEFDLNEFFRASGTGKDAEFVHASHVCHWLQLIRGQYLPASVTAAKERHSAPLPFHDPGLMATLNHTLWLLPSVAACEAMERLLTGTFKNVFTGYTVIVMAGQRGGQGARALTTVREAMADPLSTRTITLSCGKLTTGVSVPPWTGMFMLLNLESPETYFQAAFRVQTPWTMRNVDPDEPDQVLKERCFVFDFAPNRALRLVADYSTQLDTSGSKPARERVAEFLQFLPVVYYDGISMRAIDAGQLLDIVVTGTASSMLAKRFESPQLVNLDNATLSRLLARPSVVAALERLNVFRKLNKPLEAVVATENELKRKKRSGEAPDAQDRSEERELQDWRKKVRERLLKFITRVPIFMYLTDHREEDLRDVIENVEPELFTKVTGLTISEFRELCDLGVFHAKNLTLAIYTFRVFEEGSLGYAGNSKVTSVVGGWGETVSRDGARELVSESQGSQST